MLVCSVGEFGMFCEIVEFVIWQDGLRFCDVVEVIYDFFCKESYLYLNGSELVYIVINKNLMVNFFEVLMRV